MRKAVRLKHLYLANKRWHQNLARAGEYPSRDRFYRYVARHASRDTTFLRRTYDAMLQPVSMFVARTHQMHTTDVVWPDPMRDPLEEIQAQAERAMQAVLLAVPEHSEESPWTSKIDDLVSQVVRMRMVLAHFAIVQPLEEPTAEAIAATREQLARSDALARRVDVVHLAHTTAHCARALCVDKNAAAPDVEVVVVTRPQDGDGRSSWSGSDSEGEQSEAEAEEEAEEEAVEGKDEEQDGVAAEANAAESESEQVPSLGDGALVLSEDGEAPIDMVGIEAQLHLILMELVKNAMCAMIVRYGAMDVDSAPPILIEIYADAQEIAIVITDHGGGIPVAHRHSVWKHGFTTAQIDDDIGYGYSGQFGAKMEGMGVGLPFARTTARVFGGDVELQTLPGAGVRASVTLPRWGSGVISPSGAPLTL